VINSPIHPAVGKARQSGAHSRFGAVTGSLGFADADARM